KILPNGTEIPATGPITHISNGTVTLVDGTQAHIFTATSGNTAVDVTSWNLVNLTLTATNASNFALTVTASQHNPPGVSQRASAFETVRVVPLAATVPTPQNGTGPGNPINLNLGKVVVSNGVVSNGVVNSELFNPAGNQFGDQVQNKLHSLVISNV